MNAPAAWAAAAPAVLPRPAADTVELWHVDLDGLPAAEAVRLQSLLSPDEVRRMRSFYFERDRRRFLLGRGMLRTILGRYLGQAPEDLGFGYGGNGKPALVVDAGHPALAFNLSHADALAVYAIAGAGEVGVDVERVREIAEWREIAACYFEPGECARLSATPPGRRAREFLRLWARHEALLKARGVGLGADSAPTRRREPPLRVHAFEPVPGFVGALAAGPEIRRWTCRPWSEIAPGDTFQPEASRTFI